MSPTQAVGVLPAPVSYSRDDLALRGRDEWLLTNALGGFAMGTARAIGERRYHAWLVAATRPPVGRVVALSTCAEWLVVRSGPQERRIELSSLLFPGEKGEIEHPSGASRLVSFEFDTCVCRWVYEDGAWRVTRELFLHRHTNIASVRYEVRCSDAARLGDLTLELRPLTPLRDFHHLRFDACGVQAMTDERDCLVARSDAGRLQMTVDSPEARCVADPQWWHHVVYPRDRERGQEHIERLFSPGRFEIPLRPVAHAGKQLVASVEMRAGCNVDPRGAPDVVEAMSAERRRLTVIVAGALQSASRSELDRQAVRVLACAADQFIVRREVVRTADDNAGLCSIIAGYPWFSDWGRDSMISLPGLLLCCGRYGEAMGVLRAFASLRRRGLIPNCFDNSGHAEYNTLDASLWFVHASMEYARASRDLAGFEHHLLPACMEVIEAFRSGTDFNIRVDPEDGLVSAGDASTQLTWMDARRDGVVFTPRHGKAVEINALWHHALRGLSNLLRESEPVRAETLLREAERVRASFERVFWNADAGCLFDLAPPSPDADAVRPNQLFAVSLEHSPLPPEKQKRVLACVERELLTPHGVRTLAPSHPSYKPRFEGGLFQRDAAYHQGTVWPWLVGAYVEGVLRVENFSERARAAARAALRPLLEEVTGLHSRDRVPMPVHQVCEVYDGDEVPELGRRRPEGCMMQAWSVAELLRATLLTMKGES